MNLTDAQIKEIAEMIDCGFRCYVHTHSNELIFIPDYDRNPEIDIDTWADEMSKIEENYDEYFELEPLPSHESFRIMEEFTNTLSQTSRLRDRLIDALENRRPFRNFKFVIDNSGEFRQHWFDFKAEWLQHWVREQIKNTESEND